MPRLALPLCCAAALTLSLTGCTTYYSVTDPSTGKSYYTTKYKEKSGALKFEDAATGNQVSIQNSEVSKITKDQYRQATGQK